MVSIGHHRISFYTIAIAIFLAITANSMAESNPMTNFSQITIEYIQGTCIRAAVFVVAESNITTSLPYNNVYQHKFSIKNGGNFPDRFSLNVAVERGAPFIADIDPKTTQMLLPTKTEECILTITFSGQIPENIVAGSVYKITVTAISYLTNEKNTHTFFVIVNFPIIKIDYFSVNKENINVGGYVTLNFVASNRGNIDFKNGYVVVKLDDKPVFNDTPIIGTNETKNYTIKIRIDGEGPHIIHIKIGYGNFQYDEREVDIFATPSQMDFMDFIPYIVGVIITVTTIIGTYIYLKRKNIRHAK